MPRPRELLLLLLLPLLTASGARLPSRASAASPPWAAAGLSADVVRRVLGLVPGPLLLAWSTEWQHAQVLQPGADPPEFTVQASAGQILFWPSGDRFLSYPASQGALLWRARAGPPPELAIGAGGILDTQVFPAGDRVATLAAAGRVVVWDAASGEALQLILVRGRPCQMRLLGDSQLATWGSFVEFRTTAILWDLATGLSGHELRQPRGYVWKLEASPRASKLVTFDAPDHAVYVWEAATARLLRELRPQGIPCRDARVDDDAARIAVEASGTLFVWDGASGEPHTMWGDGSGSLRLFPDGRRVAAINSSDLAVWDVDSGERLVPLKTDIWLSGRLAHGIFDRGHVIEVSTCGRVLAACNYLPNDHDGSFRFVLAVWDARSGRLMFRRERAVRSPNDGCELAVASMSTMAGELLG